MRIKVNLPKSKSDIRDYPQEFRKAMQEACRFVRDSARRNRNHFYNDYTGRLTRSIRFKTEKTPRGAVRGWVYQDVTKAPYGKYQIEGTGIYVGEGKINLNKYGNFKGYFWRRENRWMKNPIVRGIKPDDFLQRALRDSRYYIDRVFERAIEKVVGKEL